MPRSKLRILMEMGFDIEQIPHHVWNVHRRTQTPVFDSNRIPSKIVGHNVSLSA